MTSTHQNEEKRCNQNNQQNEGYSGLVNFGLETRSWSKRKTVSLS